jgi:hypothetical protein
LGFAIGHLCQEIDECCNPRLYGTPRAILHAAFVAGAELTVSDLLQERLLPLLRIRPPGKRIFAGHEARHGNEYVNDAGVMPRRSFLAKQVIQFERTFAHKLARLVYAQQPEVGSAGRPDIRQVCENCNASAINFARIHRCSAGRLGSVVCRFGIAAEGTLKRRAVARSSPGQKQPYDVTHKGQKRHNRYDEE